MKILYAEDERALSKAVAEILKMEQYEVDAVYDGVQAWERLSAGNYDAAVLDIMMPKMDGIQVLSKMRSEEDYTPVLLLTAKAAVEDRIDGLSKGADDYLAKPFDMGELMARIDSMIRRATKYKIQTVRCGNITLDCDTNELKSDRGSLRLSSKETELLAFLAKNGGSVLSAAQIEEKLWKNENDEHAAVLYISYLNNKLRQLHADVEIISSEDGFILKESDAS